MTNPHTANVADHLHVAVHGVDEILTDVAFLADHWPDLLESRHIGSPRPWRQALLDPEQRALQLARDQAERELRDPDAWGFTSAPEHVDVLDVIVDAWVVLDELAALISPDWRNTRAGGGLSRHAAELRAPMPVDDIAAPLEIIRTWLPTTIDHLPAARVASISRRLHRLVDDVSRVLALVRAGQMLTGALCPWCNGVTPKHPEGGWTTMRVEVLPGSDDRKLPPLPVVVCWNILCEPPDEKVTIRMKGRPAWSHGEWDWLAKQLIVAEPQRSVPRPLPPRPAGFSDVPVLPVERFGVSGVSRTAPPAHRAETPVDDRINVESGFTVAVRVTFVGGPLARQQRKFPRPPTLLACVRTPAGRLALDRADTAAERLGEYRYELVNEQPSYVWTEAS